MYAVIETGGKQYTVNENDKIKIEKLDVEVGDTIEVDKVLMVGKEEGDLTVGNPYIENAKVSATVVDQDRAKKIIIFKKKRRKGYKKRNGHRQYYTEILINSINV